MSNSFVVSGWTVCIRRVLSGWFIILAVSLATVAMAGSGEDLINAAAGGDLNKVKLLLDGGADVNVKNNIGATALIMASQSGYKDVVQLYCSTREPTSI